VLVLTLSFFVKVLGPHEVALEKNIGTISGLKLHTK